MKDTESYCGYHCQSCVAYLATISGELKALKSVANEWGQKYGQFFSVDDIRCYGCKSNRLFILCNHCDIKSCNLEKTNAMCSDCDQYKCDRIKAFEANTYI